MKRPLLTSLLLVFIAVNLLKRIADAGQLTRALFVCDRDELRTQAGAAFRNLFGANAQEVSSQNAQKNARILIATYQTLDVASEEESANFLKHHYPETTSATLLSTKHIDRRGANGLRSFAEIRMLCR